MYQSSRSVPVAKLSFGDVESSAIVEMQVLAELRNTSIQRPVS